jgi:hypothetical protein
VRVGDAHWCACVEHLWDLSCSSAEPSPWRTIAASHAAPYPWRNCSEHAGASQGKVMKLCWNSRTTAIAAGDPVAAHNKPPLLANHQTLGDSPGPPRARLARPAFILPVGLRASMSPFGSPVQVTTIWGTRMCERSGRLEIRFLHGCVRGLVVWSWTLGVGETITTPSVSKYLHLLTYVSLLVIRLIRKNCEKVIYFAKTCFIIIYILSIS